ncbi:hypothetical protein [Methanohalophilus sp.]|uniref:hypothetical protein n=1 Tax=Methanohalophilus sp. TaxID=1966352 RepID=UPI0026080656|nr:hypothetical protein [Methanohalophilus sp.]MDK2892551.1 hypothetical protein [Methanohalophilus sp.]
MATLPIKFQIIKTLLDGGEHWNYNIVPPIQKACSMESNYGRDTINFDLLELLSAGMIEDLEQQVDEDGVFKKDFLLHKYRITDFGREWAEAMKLSEED